MHDRHKVSIHQRLIHSNLMRHNSARTKEISFEITNINPTSIPTAISDSPTKWGITATHKIEFTPEDALTTTQYPETSLNTNGKTQSHRFLRHISQKTHANSDNPDRTQKQYFDDFQYKCASTGFQTNCLMIFTPSRIRRKKNFRQKCLV